jgi:hypothetical protein
LTDVVNIKIILQDAAAAEKKNQIDAAMQILRSGLKQFPGQQELIIALAQLYEKLLIIFKLEYVSNKRIKLTTGK